MLRRSTRVAGFLLLLLQVACAQHHGSFSVVASQSVYEQIADTATGSHPRSSGRACYSWWRAMFMLPDRALPRATEVALKPFPNANALLMVKIEDDGPCLVVSGVPGRID